MMYFGFSPQSGIEFFEDELEAKDWAQSELEDFVDNDYSSYDTCTNYAIVQNICYGKITGIVCRKKAVSHVLKEI